MLKQATKKYNIEFKAEAVRRALSGTKPIYCVSKDLGIPDSLLLSWLEEHFKAKKQIDFEARISRLFRDNLKLSQDLSFIKKAAAYFSKN